MYYSAFFSAGHPWQKVRTVQHAFRAANKTFENSSRRREVVQSHCTKNALALILGCVRIFKLHLIQEENLNGTFKGETVTIQKWAEVV